MEEWRIIKDFEHYEVSNKGRVRSLSFETIRKNGRPYKHKGKFIAQRKDLGGYLYVQLYVNKKRFVRNVHKLVFEAFNGKVKGGLVIDHINNIREDNRIENLQAITNRTNSQKDTWRHKRSGLPIGVSFDKRCDKYRAYISIGNKQYHLGVFDTVEEASENYLRADKFFKEKGEIPVDLKRIRNKIYNDKKKCSCCGEIKNLSDYYISKGRVQGKCKECFKAERRNLYYKYK